MSISKQSILERINNELATLNSIKDENQSVTDRLILAYSKDTLDKLGKLLATDEGDEAKL